MEGDRYATYQQKEMDRATKTLYFYDKKINLIWSLPGFDKNSNLN